MPQHAAARHFLESLAPRGDVVVCELMLVELDFSQRLHDIYGDKVAPDSQRITDAGRGER